jgi:hypothetical protein
MIPSWWWSRQCSFISTAQGHCTRAWLTVARPMSCVIARRTIINSIGTTSIQPSLRLMRKHFGPATGCVKEVVHKKNLTKWGHTITSPTSPMPLVSLVLLPTKNVCCYSHACIWICRWSYLLVLANKRDHMPWVDVQILQSGDCGVWHLQS